MNALLKKAQEHLHLAETVVDEKETTRFLRWTVVYTLVSIAEGVWQLVELSREVNQQATFRIDHGTSHDKFREQNAGGT